MGNSYLPLLGQEFRQGVEKIFPGLFPKPRKTGGIEWVFPEISGMPPCFNQVKG
jgi:hypothetical protein